jgi:hypothetical protein
MATDTLKLPSTLHGSMTMYKVVLLVLLLASGAAFWLFPSIHCVQPAVRFAAEQGVGQQEPARDLKVPPGFRYNKVISVIAFDRYEYFRQVMNRLAEVWGAREYSLIVTIDGAPTEPKKLKKFNRRGWENIITHTRQMQWLAERGLGFKSVQLSLSETNIGVWPNKKRAVAGAFELGDFVVVLEDDILLERDALRWFEWHVESGYIFGRPEVAIATCWSDSFPFEDRPVEALDIVAVASLGLLDKFFLRSWATPWGWASWRRTWDVVGANWTGRDLHLAESLKRQGWVETMPMVARCTNIGAKGAHKRGLTEGDIQHKALTSAYFPNLDRCQYTDLGRRNVSSVGKRDEGGVRVMEIYKFVRHGVRLRQCPSCKANYTLDQYESEARNFKVQDMEVPLGKSTC